MPIALNSDTSHPAGRSCRRETRSAIGRTALQSLLAGPKRSMNSRDARCTLVTSSTPMIPTRANTSWWNSALAGRMAPTAFRWAPLASMAPERNGSRARVTSVTIDAPSVAASTLGASTTSKANRRPRSAAKARRFSAVGLHTRTRRNGRTAFTAATCVTDCMPVPISAMSSASLRASQRVPTPVIAAVRSWPSAAASITAATLPSPALNNT
jgi:hypothetical protein